MRRLTPVATVLAFLLSIFVQLNTVSAQKHEPEDIKEFEENHQAEIQEWYKQWTNPLNEPNIEEARAAGLQEFLHMNNSTVVTTASSAAWMPVGTSQSGSVSGRATCVAFDPHNAKIIYLGTSQGGLWRTNDGGTNWVSLSDKWSSLAMGGVAVDPNNSNIVYAATGDPFGVAAAGVYKSTDSGLNWTLLTTGTGSITSQMMVNPSNSDFVYLAGNAGVYLSQNAGASWTKVVGIGGVTSMAFDPNNSDIIYAAGANAIKKSFDAGKTWTSLTGFSGGNLMTIGLSKQNSAKVYLSSGSGGSSVLSRSLDSGKTWTTTSNAVGYLGQQGWYANALAVNPTNSDDVIVGGLDIYRSKNGGVSLTKKTDWTTSPGFSNFTHADVHVLVWNGNTLYTLTDGGIYYSATGGDSWKQDMNKTLATFQFVGGDAAPDMSFFAAGAQDNGIGKVTNGQSFFRQIMGGDGGTTFVGQTDGQTIYGTYLGAVLYRSDDAGASFQPAPAGGENFLANSAIMNESPGGYMEYDVCESNPGVVALCGRLNVYLTTSGGSDDCPAITTSGQIGGGPKCVHVAKADPSFIYVGGSSAIYYSTDGGASFTKSLSKVGSPSAITTDVNDPTHVYMTSGGTTGLHFYVSTDTGRTWTHPAVNPETPIPALNYKRIAVAPNGQIFLGGDYGVIRSDDGGSSWAPIREGMPTVSITALHVRGANGQYLVATTYGRGMYMLDLSQLPPVPRSGVASTVNTTPQAGSPSINAVYPNPVTASNAHVSVRFTTTQNGQAMLSIYDELGRQERMLMDQFTSVGEHVQDLDLGNIAAGHHFIVLTANGRTVTQPLNIQ